MNCDGVAKGEWGWVKAGFWVFVDGGDGDMVATTSTSKDWRVDWNERQRGHSMGNGDMVAAASTRVVARDGGDGSNSSRLQHW